MLVNPPYGERIETAGVAGRSQAGRERAQTEDGGDFFNQLAAHWKKNYAGWTAWVLTPDLQAALAHAAEGIAPRADVERPDRMPAVQLRHGSGSARKAADPERDSEFDN